MSTLYELTKGVCNTCGEEIPLENDYCYICGIKERALYYMLDGKGVSKDAEYIAQSNIVSGLLVLDAVNALLNEVQLHRPLTANKKQ
ncbi:hypothetical protein [Primorskyibacter sp. S87]|uniref:hypothetical protein n=1 Tax=Primorskyibacter sp. S87 TaxID=3415126 RepID=UPI003C7EB433